MESRRLRHAIDDVVDHASSIRPSISHESGSIAQSFGSTSVSNVPPGIFTPATTSLNGPSTSAATAATSFQEEAENSSPDLFPTQDVMEINADESFKTSFKDACEPSRADILYNDLCTKTPFKDMWVALPHKVSFRHRYELQRVADALSRTPAELLSVLGRKGISSANDHDTFWGACREIARDLSHQLPERSSSSAWKSATNSFFENDTGKRSVHLGGALSFKRRSSEGLFELKLRPLQLDISCRFHRKYGPSRFIVLSLPSLSADTPAKVKEDARSGVLTQSVARWLATTHELLGQRWKAFFLEADKKKSRTTNQVSGYKVHLFAISGEDIPTESVVGLEQFLNWHLAVDQNLKSTNLKLFQRLNLGLSKTISTFPLEASEFIRLPDPTDHAVMNDGCARMSMTLAKDIARHLGLSEMPSVFQGRIAGAKGLWMKVPDDEFRTLGRRNYCIEIADSQLKIKPHPKDNPFADPEQRTFEVLKYSVLGKPAALNTQLLTILDDRRVPRKVLGDILIADVGGFYEELELSMWCSLRLRAWVQSSGTYSRGEGDVKMTGSWPDEAEEQTIMMIESGFTPDKSSVLRECLRSILTNHLTRYVERMQIRIPCSTYLFCIPDPYGVLEPNEVHLSFSEVWKDPASGFRDNYVDRRDILVARLPALLPSDIQRRQAVWKRELHDFKDVVVFSTKGEVPLAHMLSGGDYDGDAPWICWDPAIVNNFENADLPTMPSKQDCGLVQQNRKVKDVFRAGTSREQLASQMDGFLSGCFAFNLNASYLGQCTSEHEKVVYFEGNLSTPNAIKLATLSGYLVDSARQGDVLSTAAWQKLRKQVSPRKRDHPAYKNENCEHLKRESNVVDYLKFWQAVPEKRRILTQFQKHWPQEYSRDPALCQQWISVWKLAKSKVTPGGLRATLDQLQKEVKLVADDWARQLPKDSNWMTGQFSHLIDNICEKFRAIKPTGDVHDFSALWDYEQGIEFGHWPLLRASCLYNEFVSRKMVWHIAGKELCYIKARSISTGYRVVVENVYSVLRCDSKVAKKAQQRHDEVDFEEETFGWEDIERVLMMGQDE
jgi:RNA dependent RNA polymerase